MAHKTFISYKYSDAADLRDKIIDKLGVNGRYYKGETSDSPDLTDYKTETIKQKLADMIFDTSITIVILSPNVIKSKWVAWEVKYSLRNKNRQNISRNPNKIIFVVKEVNGSYNWFLSDTSSAAYKRMDIEEYFNRKIDIDKIYTEKDFLSRTNKIIEQI